jgi:GAF domain-containing protein
MNALIQNQDKEAERLEALHQCHILDTDPEEAFDDLTRLAAHICGVPISAVSLVDEHRQWFKSIQGLPVRETGRDVAFCAHTIGQPDLMVIPDAHEDRRFADNPLVTGDPNIRFYAGAPLVTADGHALGSLCVIDRVPRQLTPEQESALRLLARQATLQLEMARHTADQERLIAERSQVEEALRRSEARLNDAQRTAHLRWKS